MSEVTVNLPPWRRIPESVKCSMCREPAVDYLATAFDPKVGKINGLSASEMLHGYVCDGCRDDLAQRFQRITGMTAMVTPVRWSWAQWRKYQRMLYVDRRGRLERRRPVTAKFLNPMRSMREARMDVLMTVGNSRIGQRLNLWDRTWFDRMM
jgi:hypothetical protein